MGGIGWGVLPFPDERTVRPLGIIVSVVDSVGGHEIDRGGVAPAIRAFAEEGGAEDGDTVEGVIRRNCEQKGEAHSIRGCEGEGGGGVCSH
jgi:hypothetical protein